MLEYGADSSIKSKSGSTALHHAIFAGSGDTVETLMRHPEVLQILLPGFFSNIILRSKLFCNVKFFFRLSYVQMAAFIYEEERFENM